MSELCGLSELNEGQAREFEVEVRSLFVIQKDGQIFAYLNDCPHAGWPLNIQPDQFLDADGQYLQCSNHMALFEIETGQCVAGPCAGDCLTKVAVEIENETIGVKLPRLEDPDS